MAISDVQKYLQFETRHLNLFGSASQFHLAIRGNPNPYRKELSLWMMSSLPEAVIFNFERVQIFENMVTYTDGIRKIGVTTQLLRKEYKDEHPVGFA